MSNKKYYPFIDGFRAFAVLSVIFFHGKALLNTDFKIVALFQYVFSVGFLGVDMFFVISGFLITGILIENWNSPVRLRRFYVRRMLKILPQYFFFLLCGFTIITKLYGVNLLDTLHDRDMLIHVLGYFFFYQNYIDDLITFSHTWSLAIEEHFYLLYPIIVFIIFKFQKNQNKRRRYLIATIIIIITLLVLDRTTGGGKDFVSRYFDIADFSNTTFFRIDALLFGCLLKFLEPYYSLNSKWPSKYFSYFCFIIGSLIYLFFITTGFAIHWSYFVLTYLAAGFLFLSAYSGFKPLLIVTENSVMRWIGRYSYGIYLWHYEVLNFHRNSFLKPIGLQNHFLSYVCFSICIGYITTKIIDYIFLGLRKKVAP